MRTRNYETYNEHKKEYSINYQKTKLKRFDVKFTNEVYNSILIPMCEILDMGITTLIKCAIVEYLLNHKECKELLKNDDAKAAITSMVQGLNRQKKNDNYRDIQEIFASEEADASDE